MRILSLRFKNLNSLAGEWKIDFTSPQFRQNGLFVIMGPTGSGKTTILDAIALAMYGRTPRLSRINKTTNDIMTQGCGECLSEVTFSTTAGTYRSLFSQRRSRGLATGALQDQKRELSDAATGRILASTLKEVETSIEQVTGMSFDQFTRSVMLAQGQFAAFLQAGSDQRAPILEQITGTGIYSEISIAVQRRYREEKDKLAALQSEADNLRLFTPQELEDQKQEIASLELRSKELDQWIRSAQQAQRWYADNRNLAQRERQLQESLRTYMDDEAEFAQDKASLARYETARPLHSGWKELQILETNQAENEKERLELETSLKTQGELVEQAKKERENATAVYDETLKQANSLTELIRHVREQDAKIVHARQDARSLETAVASYEVERASAQAALDDLKRGIGDIRRERQEAEEYLQAHKGHEQLADMLELLFDRIESIQNASERLERLEEDRDLRSQEVETRNEELVACVTAVENIVQAHAGQKATYETLQKELQELSRKGNGGSVNEQSRRLSEALGKAKEELDCANRYEKLLEDKERMAAEQRRVAQERQALENTIAVQRQLIQALDDKIALAIQNRDLAQYRDKLEQGLPCPLCGSLEHPYMADVGPHEHDADVTSAPQEEMSGQLIDAQRNLEKSLLEKGQIETMTRNLQDALAALQIQIEESRTHFITLFKDEPLLAEDPAAIVSQCEKTLAQLRASYEALQENVLRQEQLNLELAAARSALDTLTDQLSDAKTARNTADVQLQQAEQTLRRTSEDIGQTVDSRNDKVSELRKTCDELGIDIPEGFPSVPSVMKLKQTLRTSCDGYKAYSNRRDDAVKRLAVNEGKLDGAGYLLKQSEDRLTAARKDLLVAINFLDTLREERKSMFGDKDCDVEETSTRQRLNDAQSTLERAREQLHSASAASSSLNDRLAASRKRIEELRKLLDQKKDTFRRELAANGFACLEDFLEALIPEQELRRLQEHEQALRNRGLRLESERGELERHKQELEAQAPQPPYTDEAILEEILSKYRETYEETLRQIGSLQQRLEADGILRTQQEATVQAIESQLRQLQTWDSLYALIGSSDGKKFRNYAQGITFDILLAQSNRKLASMTDRYLLVRSRQEALDISVIDNYQGGDLRSTKNLSGGESFLVSLALALGLSQMASKQVRVDSLFLDEGFGTLDAETLDTALDALSTLWDDGKLIGLISHVPALKERISTQIQIIKGTGGKSTIKGPGCEQLG